MKYETIVCPFCGNGHAHITYEENRVYQMNCPDCHNAIFHRDTSWDTAVSFFKRMVVTDESALRQQEHFREVTKKVEPLTLDELREMPIRDWVWIEILNPDAFRSKETVSAYYRKYDGYKKDEIFWCGYPGLGFGFDYADYGKTWLAYRRKPEDGTL